jgi:hypothetical protein
VAQAVWAPLNPEYRAKFNETAALNRFLELEGLEYGTGARKLRPSRAFNAECAGYHNFLWGWVDTVKDNYPCLPPDYTQCLQWEHVEVLFGLLERILPATADLLFGQVTRRTRGCWSQRAQLARAHAQAFNHRMGTEGLSAADLFYLAHQRGIQANTLVTVVEEVCERRPSAVVAPSCLSARPEGFLDVQHHAQRQACCGPVHGVLCVRVQHVEGGRPLQRD